MDKRIFRKYMPMACLAALFMGLSGCGPEGDETLATPMAEVGITLRSEASGLPAEEEDTDLRVLVFDASGACAMNTDFTPGAPGLRLPVGSYRMAALRPVEGLVGLPSGGAVEGLTLDTRFSFGEGEAMLPFALSGLAGVEVSASGAEYEAALKPATGTISLRVNGLPEGMTALFELTNMYGSVGLDGSTYADVRVRELASDGSETVCFPTDGEARIHYRLTGGGAPVESTLDVGSKLEAGGGLVLELAWTPEPVGLTIRQLTVTDWQPGGNNTGSAN